MSTALVIWPFGGSAPLECNEQGVFALDCWTDYVVVSSEPWEVPSGLGKALPPAASGEHQALVNFGDYVGERRLCGATVSVSTAKLTSEGFDRLLREITERCANLPFDYQSPTLILFERSALDERDLLYHAFIYLRWAMWWASPSLLEVLAMIESDPHRTLVRERQETAVWAVHNATPAMLDDALSRPDAWQEIPATSPALGSPFAQRIASLCGRPLLPLHLREDVARTTFDTPENRFVRYFVEFLAELLDRMTTHFGRLDREGQLIESRLAEEAGELRQQLAEWTRCDFLKEVGPMVVFPASSQVLQRRSGYRELLEHYLALILAARYPISGADLTRLMEAKEASKLYEYWTFFEVADLLRVLLGEPLEAKTLVKCDEYTAYVPENQIRIRYPYDVELSYNRSYPGNLGGSYSVTLRPDITLDVGDIRHFFDAKFRVVHSGDAESSSDAAENAIVAAAMPKGWFNAEDIRKMHTYREAIRGSGTDAKPVASVWVLYPGTETVFFDQERGRLRGLPVDPARLRGVGAVPLVPGDEPKVLASLLHDLVADVSL